MEIFNKSKESDLNRFIYHFKLKRYKHNDIIYKENSKPKFLYIIKKGQVAVNLPPFPL